MADDPLRAFLASARAAYEAQCDDPRGRASCARIFAALEGPLDRCEAEAERQPACAHLRQALEPLRLAPGPLRDLGAAFEALEPHLRWYRRGGDAPGASPGWEISHANAMIVGPGGLVPDSRVWLGVSLLAPHVRYPDHRHPPEETYLVLSEGEFRQEGRGWFRPGPGGSFYNPPDILHAMRSGVAPLLAVWALRADA